MKTFSHCPVNTFKSFTQFCYRWFLSIPLRVFHALLLFKQVLLLFVYFIFASNFNKVSHRYNFYVWRKGNMISRETQFSFQVFLELLCLFITYIVHKVVYMSCVSEKHMGIKYLDVWNIQFLQLLNRVTNLTIFSA